MYITGSVVSKHAKPEHVAAALSPDNGSFLQILVQDDCVVAEVAGESLRTVIATIDDYLMNLQVSEKLTQALDQKTNSKI